MLADGHLVRAPTDSLGGGPHYYITLLYSMFHKNVIYLIIKEKVPYHTLYLTYKMSKLFFKISVSCSDLGPGETGLYTCTATSASGETSWSAHITVEDPKNPNIIFHRSPDPSTFPLPPTGNGNTLLNKQVFKEHAGYRMQSKNLFVIKFTRSWIQRHFAALWRPSPCPH